jgi:hypothetical protein
MIENDPAVKSYTVTTVPVTLKTPQYWDSSDIIVYDVDSGGNGSLLSLDTHYTVSGANAEDGGSLALTSRVHTGTSTIVVICDPGRTQDVDYIRNDDFPADTHETALDKLTRMVQMTREYLDRTFQWEIYDTTETTAWTLAQRSSKIAGFDSDGAVKLYDQLTLETFSYQGEHDASTGAPASPSAGQGWYITTAGSFGTISWVEGDYAVYTGTAWVRIPATAGGSGQLEYADVATLGGNASLTTATNISAVTTGDTVLLKGYYAAGDFGEPIKLIVEASTGGVKSYGPLSDGRYANLYADGPLNVKWFGAKVDGVTDDSLAWLAVQATGQVGYAPAGSHALDTTIADSPKIILDDGAVLVDLGSLVITEASHRYLSDTTVQARIQTAFDDLLIDEPAVIELKYYLRTQSEASLTAILAYDTTGQNATANTTAIQAAFDDALTYIKSSDSGQAGAIVVFPAGLILVNDELLSDAFQTSWWAGTDLFKNQYIRAVGQGSGVTTIQIDSSWPSAVRNTANANRRDFGPWDGEDSPMALFPLMAQFTGLAEFSIQSMMLRGQFIPGKDPIPILTSNEYASKFTDLRVLEFANHGEVIQGGTFNSVRSFCVFEDCGMQPSDSAIATMSTPAGFPPYWVAFDVSGGNTLTAKATQAKGGYAIGDAVPYFQPAMVGKEMIISDLSQIFYGATPIGVQPLKVTISAVSGANSSTCTFTHSGTLVSPNPTGVAGSFLPVQATTTASLNTVTLSSPVKIGDGAADMVGLLVFIPKAGFAPRSGTSDLMAARILAVSNGSDSAGYSTLTLSEAAEDTVTEDIIFGSAHVMHSEPNVVTGITGFNSDELRVDDMDFIHCRWELSRGYADDQVTSAYQFVISGAGESVQYVSCKIHGATPVDRSNYALDGAAIIDDCDGVSFVGSDFTHIGFSGKGGIWLMGIKNQVNFTGCSVGGWKLPDDWATFYADPMTSTTYIPDLWQVIETGTLLKNDLFPNGNQLFLKWSAAVGDYRDVFGPRDRETRIETTKSLPTTDFQDATHRVNLVGKFEGKIHYNYTDGKLYYARGTGATDVWLSTDGVTTLTPV